MAFRSALATGVRTYKLEYLIPDEEFEFDSFDARMARYWMNARYYDDTMYHALAKFAESLKESERLYKFIRSLRNPVSRLVKLEAAKTFGGVLNYYDLTEGCMPLLFKSDYSDQDEARLTDAIRQLWQWSAMHRLKNSLPLTGGKFGDSFVNVVDDQEREKVYMTLLDPRKVHDWDVDHMGNIKRIDIRYELPQEDRDGNLLPNAQTYTKKVLIDGDSFQYFKDEEPWDYVNNVKNGPMAAYTNPYGFVPVEHIPHVYTGNKSGETSYNGSIGKINNLNDLVSLIHDNVRNVVQTRYAVMTDGSIGEGTFDASQDSRDKSMYMKLDQGGDIKPIASAIPIEHSAMIARDLQHEIEANMPQLSLQRIREDQPNMSGVAISNLYGDAIDMFGSIQGNYIGGIISATQMGISIGALRGYDGFEGYSLDSYAQGDLTFTIKPKPIFKDEMTSKEKLELVVAASKSPTILDVVLEEIGYGDHVEKVRQNTIDLGRSEMRGMFDAVFNQQNQNPQGQVNDPTNAPTAA